MYTGLKHNFPQIQPNNNREFTITCHLKKSTFFLFGFFSNFCLSVDENVYKKKE